jgi:conjugative transfer region protein TrbK
MDGKILARIAAVIFVAVAVTATALEMARKQEEPAGTASFVPASEPADPVRDGLRHCQGLGSAALRDGDCLRLWAQQRDRFLGYRAPSVNPASTPVVPRPSGVQKPEAR